MKQTFTILGIVCGFFALLLAVLPISNLAIFPAIFAFIFGGAAYYFSKKTGEVKKIIPFTILITMCALSLTTYKAFFVKTEVVDTTILNEKEAQFEEKAIEELDNLEINTADLETVDDDVKIEEVEINQADLETIEFEDLR